MPTQEEIDDWIALKLARQNAPAGSPQEVINQRYPNVSWRTDAEMQPAMDTTPDPDPYNAMDPVGLQHFWRNLPAMTNEAGAKSFIESPGPMSTNIEDRREQTPMEVIPGVMQWLAQGKGADEDLSGLTPQQYIDRVIGGMHQDDYYYGGGAENYQLPPGVAPSGFDINRSDGYPIYPTRKVSR